MVHINRPGWRHSPTAQGLHRHYPTTTALFLGIVALILCELSPSISTSPSNGLYYPGTPNTVMCPGYLSRNERKYWNSLEAWASIRIHEEKARQTPRNCSHLLHLPIHPPKSLLLQASLCTLLAIRQVMCPWSFPREQIGSHPCLQ